MTALALTWLKPHVYLDTVVLLARSRPRTARAAGVRRRRGPRERGLVSALGYGAALLRPLFARPTAWRVLDALIAP